MAKRRAKRALTAEEAADRRARQRRDDLLGLCPEPMPAAQRDPDAIAAEQVPELAGAGKRTATRTVRRLTRVEKLLRAGVIEQHQADVCAWYADTAALAWDTTGCTASYEGRSGGGGAHAPDRLMAKHRAIAEAREDYREARALLPAAYAAVFEAIVLRNEAVGPTAAAAFAELKRSRAEERTRTVVKFCADLLATRLGATIGLHFPAREPTPAAKPAAPAAPREAAPQVGASITREVDRAVERSAAADELWIAPAMLDELRREGTVAGEVETGPDEEAVVFYRGLPLVVREGWRWGCVAVGGTASRAEVA